MRGFERAVRRTWQEESGPIPFALGLVTAPLSVLFGIGVRTRNLLYDWEVLPARAGALPVVSVGNLAVGGTGKTPVAAWLVRSLRERGWHPALVTRGYGEDEVLLHERWNPQVPVVRAVARREGVERAATMGRDVAVIDDGFQHRRLRRDVDIVLLSPVHANSWRLLPRGPFREPLRALRRADQVLVTAKGRHELPAARALADEVATIPGVPPVDLFPFAAGGWQTLDGASAPPPSEPPWVVTSVAEPRPFVQLVAAQTGAIAGHLGFRDHHRYTRADAERISEAVGNGWLATTEKDAVKLRRFDGHLPEARVLPLHPEPDPRLAAKLLDRLGPRGSEAASR